MIMDASAFAMPSWYVLWMTSSGFDQYFSKKIGKNPAITVVEKAEFAQSYIDQAQIFLFCAFIIFHILHYCNLHNPTVPDVFHKY